MADFARAQMDLLGTSPSNEPEQGGLSRSRGSDDRVDGAFGDLEVHAAKHGHAAKSQAQPLCLQQQRP